MTVLSTIRPYPVDVDADPSSLVTTDVVGHATSRDVVNDGIEMVVTVDNGHGGRIKLQGGMQAIVADDSFLYINGSIYTSPEPPVEPSGSAPARDVSDASRLAGLDKLPGPPRSNAQAKVPPKHLALAKSLFWRSVFALSNDTLDESASHSASKPMTHTIGPLPS